jgi:hypothetical protein
MRPPGMKAGGAVKKAANGGRIGGKIGSKSLDQGKGYRGFPNSPTTEVDSAVSAHKTGGGVKKLQFGGTGGPSSMGTPGPQNTVGGVAGLLGNIPGRAPTPPIQGPPNISGRPARPAMPVTVPMPATASSLMARQAPGLGVTYSKRGGKVPASEHSDEAEDKVLMAKEFKKRGLANGGSTDDENTMGGGVAGGGMAAGGLVKTPVTKVTGGGAGGKARKAKSRAAKSAAGQTGSPNPGKNQTARGLAGSSYHQQGKGMK